MNNMSWFILETLALERMRELAALEPRILREQDIESQGLGVRRTLAAMLVRLGLRLDPAAGEGLRAFELKLTREGGEAS
jgi:hypothetical protein